MAVFFWLTNLTVIGSEVWDAHLQGVPAALTLPVYAAPWLTLLLALQTFRTSISRRAAALALLALLSLGVWVQVAWYVPFDAERKAAVERLRGEQFQQRQAARAEPLTSASP